MPEDAICFEPKTIRLADADCVQCQIPFNIGEGYIGADAAMCDVCLEGG